MFSMAHMREAAFATTATHIFLPISAHIAESKSNIIALRFNAFKTLKYLFKRQ